MYPKRIDERITCSVGVNTQGMLNDLAKEVNRISTDHGFWEGQRNFGEMIALAHSELSEALEEHRHQHPPYWDKHEPMCPVAMEVMGTPDEKECECLPKPEGIAVELVDCVIRCLDTLHSLGVDIDDVMMEKMSYNDKRPYKHGREY